MKAGPQPQRSAWKQPCVGARFSPNIPGLLELLGKRQRCVCLEGRRVHRLPFLRRLAVMVVKRAQVLGGIAVPVAVAAVLHCVSAEPGAVVEAVVCHGAGLGLGTANCSGVGAGKQQPCCRYTAKP